MGGMMRGKRMRDGLNVSESCPIHINLLVHGLMGQMKGIQGCQVARWFKHRLKVNSNKAITMMRRKSPRSDVEMTKN